MRTRRLLSSFILIIAWYILAKAVNVSVLLPGPVDVARKMIEQLTSALFYASIGITLFRCFISILISAIIGIVLGMLAGYSEKVEDWLFPIESIMKSFPTVSYIIIVLMWLGSNRSVYVVTILVLFPIFYTNIKNDYKGIDKSLIEASELYLEKKDSKVNKVYLPLLKNSIVASFQLAIGMGLKVSVSAEVLGNTQSGVGQQIIFAKNNLDMITVFSWTAWLLILVVIFSKFITCKLIHK